jgi:prepilin-type N-terminal cleavage/methylation domain-containing protein
MARRGLTLIELLVVIGVIALLLAISFPALWEAKNQAQGAVCLQNLRNLSLAWLLYKDDNDDRLVGGSVGTGKDASGRDSYDWMRGPTGTGGILERKKEGVRQGALFEYVGGDVDIYQCPADQRKLIPDQMAFASYSIAGGANGEEWQNAYVPARKYSEILRPATKYVFVEEADRRGWNKGSWILNPREGTWVDPLAIWHSRGRSTLGFADGRAEIHRWVDDSTIEMARKQEFLCPVPPGEGEDLRFMVSGFPQKNNEASPSSAGRTSR